jgi:predicted flap endonuclease-1-like 5' DNA nuclease
MQPEAEAPEPAGARRTLALRIAERNRMRELRAERLARLRPPGAPPPAAEDDASAALEEFLRALTGGGSSVPESPPEPAAVLPFQRPEPAPCDLDRLPGAGPGLVWALKRAGLGSLAEVAALEAAELADRLGPLGRLVPAGAWIEAARRAGA